MRRKSSRRGHGPEILSEAREAVRVPGRKGSRVRDSESAPPYPDPKAMSLVPVERIEHCILLIRGHKVMLDDDLAELYAVPVKVLNQAVKRNLSRFPADFMFQLSQEEFANLKFHIGTSSWGGTRKLPRAFTEQGVAMLSSVLRSKRAVLVNVEIMRAFVRLRHILATHAELSRKLNEMERKLGGHDEQFAVVFEAIRQLMEPDAEAEAEPPPKGRIGFHKE